MKLVLDTNVLIAALITRGVCADLLDHPATYWPLLGKKSLLIGGILNETGSTCSYQTSL